MFLKIFGVLIIASLAGTMLMQKPQARRIGWIVTGSLLLFGLLVVQILRTLDTMWR